MILTFRLVAPSLVATELWATTVNRYFLSCFSRLTTHDFPFVLQLRLPGEAETV